MYKKFFVIIMFLATTTVARAFDFSQAAPTGQMLYFSINGTEAEVVNPEWDYYVMPTGTLVLPAAVEHNGVTYSVTTIGQSAFEGCSGLTRVVVPEGVTAIEGFAFYYCTALDTIELPTTLTEILSQAFTYTGYASNAANRDEQGLLYIGRYLIGGAQRDSVVVADSTLGIAGMAFYYNHTIQKVTLPATLRFIAGQAFADCIALDTVRCLGSEVPHATVSTFLQSPAFTVAVPCNAGDAYSADAIWGNYNIVEDCSDTVQAVDDVMRTALHVDRIPGGIVVHGACCNRLTVSDMAGRIVAVVSSASDGQRIALPSTGMYLLMVDGCTPVKVIYSK